VAAETMNLDTLEEHAKHLAEKDVAWIVGHTIPAAEAIDLGVDLADHVARWMGACLPLYRFLAWTRDNDHIDVGRQLAEDKAQKRRQATGYNPGDRVRIISGLFAGKAGVVQDVDTKAQVKIRVGKMSVVVPGIDLTTAT
jgi:transcription antitermination factor NusG